MPSKTIVRTVVLAIALIFSFAVVGEASAQQPTAPADANQGAQHELEAASTQGSGATDPRVTRARQLFAVGVQLLDGQLYTDALHSFEQSFELVPRPNTLNNIGVCLRAIGRHRDARDKFQQLLTQFPNADAELLTQVRLFREEESRKVSTLALTGLPEAEGLAIRVDGQEIDVPSTRPVRIEVDRGSRSVDVRATGYHEFHWQDEVREGEVVEVPVHMTELPPPPSIASSPWLWIAVGVVVAAGAGVTYYFLDKDAQLDAQGPFVVHL